MPEQIKAFSDILDALTTTGILPDVILIGGWAQYLYRLYFDDPVELSALRTVDVDILFRRPPAIKVLKPLTETLEELGFIRLYGPDGSTKFASREMEIDFLIPDRGRGDESPYLIPELSIFVQRPPIRCQA
ncbi:MAG: GSU2403 family nucleotidyltransferase fold protein [Rectinemataceae bacterium]|nr:GSU2403 family nucleotidyltransferase fold protein [Rectinemataceae bacterium]